MTNTSAATATVTRNDELPATGSGKPPAGEDLWGTNWAEEKPSQPASRGNDRGGRYQRAELPPLRTLDQRRRKPTGMASHPSLLLSGGNQSGKSWQAAAFSGDERIGHTYWVEVGRESTGDWYGAVPGARYELFEHDGTWRDMIDTLRGCHGEAHERVLHPKYDFRPPMLVVDSQGGVWEHLCQWANARAMLAQSNVLKLLADPHAEIDTDALKWNAANTRHNAWMALALNWPGPVIFTARGKMSMAVNEKTGNLDHKTKVYNVNVQKDVPFDTTMHVRLDTVAHPEVLGYRHPTHGIGGKHGGKTVVVDPSTERFAGVDFNLGWLFFDVMRYNPKTAVTRVVNNRPPEMDTDVQLPDPRKLSPAAVAAAYADADEAPGKATAGETAPQKTR